MKNPFVSLMVLALTMLVIMTFVIGVRSSSAAEPIIKLPPLPDANVIELYEDSEELFAMKVLEYYQYAVAYRSQIQLWDTDKDVPTVQQPTLEDLTSTDADVIIHFYAIAQQMLQVVRQLPDSKGHAEIKSLRKKLLACALEKEEGEKLLFESQLESKHLRIYAAKWKHFISTIDSLVFAIDSLQLKNHVSLMEQRKRLNAMYQDQWKYYLPVLSASIEGYDIFTRTDNLGSEFSVGTTVSLNAAALLGLGRNLEFYFTYIYPKFTSYGLTYYRPMGVAELAGGETKWNSDIYILGIKANFPEIFNQESFNAGFKFGGGYFWGEGKADNIYNSFYDMKGGVIHAELNISKFNRLVPLEVFIAYTGFIFSDPLAFNTNAGQLDLGKPYFHSLSFGMRITLWKDHLYDLIY